MKLPNRAKAYIPSDKITDYLLSETHAIGKSKARYFRSYGFDLANITHFEQSLLSIVQNEEIEDVTKTPHGIKYVIDGQLESPNGVKIRIRTIWIIESGQESPRFVTAYPVD